MMGKSRYGIRGIAQQVFLGGLMNYMRLVLVSSISMRYWLRGYLDFYIHMECLMI